MGSDTLEEEGEQDVEKGLSGPRVPEKGFGPKPNLKPLTLPDRSAAIATSSPSSSATPTPSFVLSSSSKSLVVSNSGKALVLSNSGKRIDQLGKTKYVKQVTGRHNDTELHLAAQRGDLTVVKQILDEINAQMTGLVSGEDFDTEVAEIRSAVVNEVNELGETALFAAAEKGHLDVVKVLLPHSTKEGITNKNRCGFNPLHIAATNGHHAIVQVLLKYDPTLSKTLGPSNATPLVSSAARGHVAIVKQLLSRDPRLIEISRSNGKNAFAFICSPGACWSSQGIA